MVSFLGGHYYGREEDQILMDKQQSLSRHSICSCDLDQCPHGNETNYDVFLMDM